jgi:hypothetical protein
MQVDNCNDDDPTTLSCYHGSKCRSTNTGINTNNIDEENGEGGGYYCDCLQLNNISGGPTAMKYAGLMCQHEATSLCAAAVVGSSTTTSVSSPGYYQPSGDQFCTNHGKCVKLVTSYDSHPGCVCMFGWGGDHCEVWHGEGSSPSAATLQNVGESSRNVVAWYILFGLFIVALSAVAMGTVILLIEAIKRQRGSQPNAISAQSPIVTTAPNEEERDAMSQEEEREVYTQSGNDHDDSSNPEIV